MVWEISKCLWEISKCFWEVSILLKKFPDVSETYPGNRGFDRGFCRTLGTAFIHFLYFVYLWENNLVLLRVQVFIWISFVALCNCWMLFATASRSYCQPHISFISQLYKQLNCTAQIRKVECLLDLTWNLLLGLTN